MTEIEIDLIGLESSDVDLTEQIVREIKLSSPGDARAFLNAPGSVAYAATHSNNPIGWAYGYVLERPDGGRMMLLYEIEVVADWRRKGVGRRLVGAFRDHAVEAGCQSMWLVTDDDISAQMLYQLEGANTEGTRLQFAWRDLPARIDE